MSDVIHYRKEPIDPPACGKGADGAWSTIPEQVTCPDCLRVMKA